jgi:uncharacterized RDD family membrane protein YckC
LSNFYIVDTPENVSFNYDVAGIGSRFLATLIDSLIQGTIYVFLFVVFALVEFTGVLTGLPRQVTALAPVLLLLVLFLVQFGYFLLFELFTGGQTPGKQLFNLRVIKENGYPLSPIDSIIRNLVRIIDFFPVAYGIGVIVMFFNDRARRLGDYAAGTLVVKMRDEVRLSDLQAAAPAANAYVPDLPGIENLNETDIELVESFLKRRSQLRDPAPLADTLARTVRAQLNSPQAEEASLHVSHEEFLRQVMAAYRKAHQKP